MLGLGALCRVGVGAAGTGINGGKHGESAVTSVTSAPSSKHTVLCLVSTWIMSAVVSAWPINHPSCLMRGRVSHRSGCPTAGQGVLGGRVSHRSEGPGGQGVPQVRLSHCRAGGPGGQRVSHRSGCPMPCRSREMVFYLLSAAKNSRAHVAGPLEVLRLADACALWNILSSWSVPASCQRAERPEHLPPPQLLRPQGGSPGDTGTAELPPEGSVGSTPGRAGRVQLWHLGTGFNGDLSTAGDSVVLESFSH